MHRYIGYAVNCLCLFALGVSILMHNSKYSAPTIPVYPNHTGSAEIPSRIEAQLLGESFGGFRTVDSAETVQAFYAQRLPENGWKNGWYQNRAGYCYTLLIIPSHSVDTIAAGTIGIGFKLRQAFSSELHTTAPAGCR